jgi:hypothetical protein
MDFESIVKAVGDRSRRSLFRDLASLGYLTSYTHAGRYYTLAEIPQFDEHGLWFHRGIGFTRAGTLKNTLVNLIEVAEAGCTHQELKNLLHVRVHNTLLILVHDKRINRQYIEKLYVYVSSGKQRAGEQVAKRQELLKSGEKLASVHEVPMTIVIEVLIEVIRASKVSITPAEVAQRLGGRGIPVTISETEQVYKRYGLIPLKKTPR